MVTKGICMTGWLQTINRDTDEVCKCYTKQTIDRKYCLTIFSNENTLLKVYDRDTNQNIIYLEVENFKDIQNYIEAI